MFTIKSRWTVYFTLAYMLTAYLVYSPHLSYPYPLHLDEYHNIYESRSLIRGEYDFGSRNAYEIGYHLFLAIPTIAGLDLIYFTQYLPAFYAVFTAFALTLLVYLLTKSRHAALYSVLFYGSLPSNVNLLGSWFAVPSTFTAALIILSFYLLVLGLQSKDRKYLVSFAGLLALLTFIYPVSAFLVFLVAGSYLLIHFRHRRWDRRIILLPALAFLGLIIYSMLFGTQPYGLLENLVFPRGWTPLEPGVDENPHIYDLSVVKLRVSPYFMPVLYGFVPFTLALYGLIHSLKGYRLILSVWLILCLILLFMFNSVHLTVLIPYQRAVYYTLLALAPLSGIGLDEAVKKITHRIRRKKAKRNVKTAVLALVLLSTFWGYGSQRKGTELYYLVEEEDLAAFRYLAELPPGLVLSQTQYAMAIQAVSHKKVLAGMLFIGEDRWRSDTKRFYSAGCTEKTSIIRRYGIKYVYSVRRISCPGFNKIYSKGTYIYSTG